MKGTASNSTQLLLRRDDALAVIIDVQEKLLPAIADHEALLARTVAFTTAMKTLGVPLLVSEQYPKGLGPTVPELRSAVDGVPILVKTAFGCLGDEAFLSALRATGRKTLLLCGIETHVCVLQTALQAREMGLAVHVIEDCVGSRRREDKAAGLARMAAAGCVGSSLEMAVFELLERAGTPLFKAILPLVK